MPDADLGLGGIFDHAPVGLVLLEADGRIAWTNATYRRWAPGGAGRDAPRGFRDDPGLRAPALLAAIEEGLALAAGTGGSPPHASAVPFGDGAGPGPRFVDLALAFVPSGDDRPRRLLAVLSDAGERLGEHEQARLLYEAFLTSTNAMEVTDRHGFLVDVNPAFEATYGYSRAECIGRKPSLVRSGRTSPETYARMWKDLLDPNRGNWSGEIVNRDRSGRDRPVFLTVTAVKNEAGEVTHYVGVAVDLTEQKAWERLAAHSERLSSLGQLAAGVAHEINTPLANVMLVAESLRRRATDPWTRQRAETIAAQVDVAARIVRGLLDFARRSEPQVTRLDLSAVARQAVGFLRGKQPANVEVEEHYPPEPQPIFGDRGQLMQVFTNILLNAYDALEGASDGRIWVEVRSTGPDVEIEIRDNGPGIPVEALPRVFDPFFTTKPEGRGTGLGLAICHGIVQAHGGTIAARNVPGSGASLLVTLPLVGGLSGPSVTAGTAPSARPAVPPDPGARPA